MLLIDGNPVFFYYKKQIVPTLKFLLENMVLPKVTVDMGAVKHIVNGADIMRPGITDIDTNIEKEDVIVVVDETHGKPLVVGIAKYDAADMEKMDEGNVIENIHHIGDDVWNYT